MIETLCQGVKSAHDWTPEQKNSMRRLFEYALRTWPNLVVCVRETQGTLVFRAQEKGNYDWRSLADFDLELIRLADSGEQEAALNRIAEKLRMRSESSGLIARSQATRFSLNSDLNA